jgi:hypothetical protein
VIAATPPSAPPLVRCLLAAGLLLAVGAARPVAGGEVRTESAGLRFTLPSDWPRVPAPSDVRAAQWRIPRAPGDAEDGELILFFFGSGQGGAAEDNLDRWYRQFTQPDGRPSREAAVVTTRTVRGLKVTSVDLPGTYSGGTMAPGPATKPKPGARLLGAIVEGGDGPWFFKGIGPDATMTRARPAFEALLGSVEAHR